MIKIFNNSIHHKLYTSTTKIINVFTFLYTKSKIENDHLTKY